MNNFLTNSAAFDAIAAMHASGLSFGKTIGLFGAGFSIGKNFIRVVRGKINGGVAVANIIRDAAIFFGVSYLGAALSTGAINMAKVVTGNNTPTVDVGAATADVTGSAVGESATDLAVAANELIEKITSGLFGMMSSTGATVGGKLTEATADTAMGGTVSAFVGTFGTMGNMFGGTVSAIIPALIFGAVIGIIFAFIFDK